MRIRHHSIPVVVTVLLLGILSPALADDYEDASRLLNQGKHAAALKKVDAAIASNPQDARARFLKGLILTEQNNTEAAIQVFTLLFIDRAGTRIRFYLAATNRGWRIFFSARNNKNADGYNEKYVRRRF